MDWLRYANQGATRNLSLSNDLATALGQFIPGMGLQVEVFSGGQPTAGNGARVGSVRHDHGNAADVFFYRDGERLDWANPNHLPVFQDIVRQGRAAGLTGFGAGPGYMRPGSMHIGFGNPGVWGAGGRSANAPGWLAEAFNGATGPVTQVAAAPQAGASAPATPEGLAAAFAPPSPAALAVGQLSQAFSEPRQQTAQPPAPPAAALTGDPGGVMSGIASAFLQNQRERQERQREYQQAEQQRRTALLSSMFA